MVGVRGSKPRWLVPSTILARQSGDVLRASSSFHYWYVVTKAANHENKKRPCEVQNVHIMAGQSIGFSRLRCHARHNQFNAARGSWVICGSAADAHGFRKGFRAAKPPPAPFQLGGGRAAAVGEPCGSDDVAPQCLNKTRHGSSPPSLPSSSPRLQASANAS
eukprot:scaffold4239_cov318-Pinguiococcus_pyrenoidosus.AAC.1